MEMFKNLGSMILLYIVSLQLKIDSREVVIDFTLVPINKLQKVYAIFKDFLDVQSIIFKQNPARANDCGAMQMGRKLMFPCQNSTLIYY